MHVTTLKGVQEMDVQCSSSNGAVLLPQHYVPGSTPGGDPVMLGPLFPGQFLVCQAGSTIASTLPCTHVIAGGVLGHANPLLKTSQTAIQDCACSCSKATPILSR